MINGEVLKNIEDNLHKMKDRKPMIFVICAKIYVCYPGKFLLFVKEYLVLLKCESKM